MRLGQERVDFRVFAFFGQGGHEGQISAGGKRAGHAAGLVADDKAHAVGIHVIRAFAHELNDLAVEGVHLGVKFAAEHAVADVHQGCGFAGFDDLARSFQGCQGDDILADLDVLVGSGGKIIILDLAGFGFIECGMAGCDHFFDCGRNLKTVFFHFGNGFDQSDGIPGFKRAHGEIIAPFHGVIDFNDGVGNFRNPVGRINQVVGKDFPGIAGAFVIAVQHGFHFIGRVLAFLASARQGKSAGAYSTYSRVAGSMTFRIFFHSGVRSVL